MSKIFKYYEFDLDNDYTVYVSDSWIVSHMIEYNGLDVGNMPDRMELISDFVAIHWAEEVNEGYLLHSVKSLMAVGKVNELRYCGDDKAKVFAELLELHQGMLEE